MQLNSGIQYRTHQWFLNHLSDSGTNRYPFPIKKSESAMSADPPKSVSSLPEEAAEPTAAGSSVADTLNAHKGKLAIGVAATLGLMVYYNWREKRLAKTDPEEYARLQRLRAGLRAGEAQADREAQPAPTPLARPDADERADGA
jgi:hypothetical protein